jgi:small subunit ribosomal protein S9
MNKEEKQNSENPFFGKKYIGATGRRKSSVATVKLYVKGKGEFLINHQKISKYFGYSRLEEIAKSSLLETSNLENIDISAKVSGGGLVGQAQAIRLAIARALIVMEEELKPALRKAGFLTVDSRVKERKKPGLKRARRAPQWSKR